MSISTNALDSNNDWRLNCYNAKNESMTLIPVRQLDIYFWREEDAQVVLEALTTLPMTSSVLINGNEVKARVNLDKPSLVEALEHVAAGVPLRTSINSSIASEAATVAQSSFTPAAYNPASPAAPERIVYREKTPPPDDVEHGLAASLTVEPAPIVAQIADQQHQGDETGNQFSMHQQQTLQHNVMLAPPISRLSSYQTEPSLTTSNPEQVTIFAPPPTAQASTPEQLQSLFSPGAAPATPPTTGGLPLRNSSEPQPTYPRSQYATYNIPPPPPPTIAQVEHSPPGHMHFMTQMYSPSYVSQSQYGTPTTGTFPRATYTSSVPASPYAIHGQVYRPNEAEMSRGHGGSERKTSGGVLSIVDARAEKVEKGVGKWLKRLDKRL